MGSKQIDCIVVVAGPTGCLLANRLCEDPSTQVLRLEAGKDADTDRKG